MKPLASEPPLHPREGSNQGSHKMTPEKPKRAAWVVHRFGTPQRHSRDTQETHKKHPRNTKETSRKTRRVRERRGVKSGFKGEEERKGAALVRPSPNRSARQLLGRSGPTGSAQVGTLSNVLTVHVLAKRKQCFSSHACCRCCFAFVGSALVACFGCEWHTMVQKMYGNKIAKTKKFRGCRCDRRLGPPCEIEQFSQDRANVKLPSIVR